MERESLSERDGVCAVSAPSEISSAFGIWKNLYKRSLISLEDPCQPCRGCTSGEVYRFFVDYIKPPSLCWCTCQDESAFVCVRV